MPQQSRLSTFLSEPKRRRVFRVVAAAVITSVVLQLVSQGLIQHSGIVNTQ